MDITDYSLIVDGDEHRALLAAVAVAQQGVDVLVWARTPSRALELQEQINLSLTESIRKKILVTYLCEGEKICIQ